MSLSGALSNAISGLQASSLAANVVSNNIANALNEDYATRSVSLEQNRTGSSGGVRVSGIVRAENELALQSWRAANSNTLGQSVSSEALSRVDRAYGLPGEAGSLQSYLSRLETDLASASSRPDIPQRLEAVAYSKNQVLAKTADISQTIQSERQRADNDISNSVQSVNAILAELETINAQVMTTQGSTNQNGQLLDRRDALLNDLSGYMEIRVFNRDQSGIAVYTTGGLGLLDGNATVLEFQSTNSVTAFSSVSNNTLQNVQVNGQNIDVARFGKGTLSSNFNLRDADLVTAQSELDAFAFEFANRINDPAIDPTRGPTDLGFITDNGALVDISNVVGLSTRLTLNSTVDPAQGGNANRLRDGVLSVVSSPGESALLVSLSQQLTSSLAVTAGQYTGETRSVFELADLVVSDSSNQVVRAELSLTTAQAEMSFFDELKFANNVNSDLELQTLLTLEQSYAANAQVIQVVDELMNTLLEAV